MTKPNTNQFNNQTIIFICWLVNYSFSIYLGSFTRKMFVLIIIFLYVGISCSPQEKESKDTRAIIIITKNTRKSANGNSQDISTLAEAEDAFEICFRNYPQSWGIAHAGPNQTGFTQGICKGPLLIFENRRIKASLNWPKAIEKFAAPYKKWIIDSS